MSSPRILRLTSCSSLVSATAFEEAFTRHLASYVEIETANATTVLDDVLGPLGQHRSDQEARLRLKANVKGAEFICLDYQSFYLLPLLASLRNREGLPVRLLLIAHAPGAYHVDFALLRLLLRPGDRVIAPTERARHVIENLCPEMDRWVRVVPHPVPDAPGDDRHRSGLMFLGRVVEGKVLHRVLDALALMGTPRKHLRFDIVGPLGRTVGELTPYVRTLIARRRRLGLEDVVSFRGPVDGVVKADLLARAGALVNLSLTLEESFGKSVAEALASGVPAVVTDWDGLGEVAGPTGTTVPVTMRPLAVDVDPSVVATGLERILNHLPSAPACRESALRFHPQTVGPRYRDVLEDALDERDRAGVGADDGPDRDAPAAPSTGLLAGAAPLTGYTWGELYEAVVGESDRIRANLTGAPLGPLTEAGEVRTRLYYGLRRSLEHLFAGIDYPTSPRPLDGATSLPPRGTGFLDRVELAVDRASNVGSIVLCLQFLWFEGRRDAVRQRLKLLRARGVDVAGAHYLEVESVAECGSGDDALDLCLAPSDPGWWDEHAATRLCQLASVAIRAERPDRALPRLRAWTESYPDAPEAGTVWLSRARCAGLAGLGDECASAVRAARDLMGEHVPASVLAALLAGIHK